MNLDEVQFNDEGHVPVIAQDHATGAVLMLAWADRDALQHSIDTGRMTYWSRSRNQQWVKGDTSGHTQRVIELRLDCDGDAVLATVEQTGPACHTGDATCWNVEDVAGFMGALEKLCRTRLDKPAGGYTDKLLADSTFAASKIEEEAGEVGAVLRGEDNDDTLAHEAADLLYHLIVGLHSAGTDMRVVLKELAQRR